MWKLVLCWSPGTAARADFLVASAEYRRAGHLRCCPVRRHPSRGAPSKHGTRPAFAPDSRSGTAARRRSRSAGFGGIVSCGAAERVGRAVFPRRQSAPYESSAFHAGSGANSETRSTALMEAGDSPAQSVVGVGAPPDAYPKLGKKLESTDTVYALRVGYGRAFSSCARRAVRAATRPPASSVAPRKSGEVQRRRRFQVASPSREAAVHRSESASRWFLLQDSEALRRRRPHHRGAAVELVAMPGAAQVNAATEAAPPTQSRLFNPRPRRKRVPRPVRPPSALAHIRPDHRAQALRPSPASVGSAPGAAHGRLSLASPKKRRSFTWSSPQPGRPARICSRLALGRAPRQPGRREAFRG